jgi:hypothetical protein
MLDGIARSYKLAIKMPTFAKSPKVVAVLYSHLESLNQLLSHYASKGGDSGGTPTSVMPEGDDGGNSDAHYTSADTDAQPAPDSGS